MLVVAGEGADPVAVIGGVGRRLCRHSRRSQWMPGRRDRDHRPSPAGLPEVARDLRPDTAVVLGRAGLSRNLSAFIATVDTVGVGRGWFDPDRRVSGSDRSSFVRRAANRIVSGVRSWDRAESIAREVLDSELDAIETPASHGRPVMLRRRYRPAARSSWARRCRCATSIGLRRPVR